MAEITAVIAPVAPIEHDVSFPTSVMLDGTGSIAGDPANHEDPAPTITGWAWSIIWQKTGSTANLINANTSTPTLQGITAGDSVYIYLQVTNSEGASTPADPIPTQRAEAPYDFVKPAITAFVAVVVKLANTDLVYPPVGSRGWFPTSYYPLIAEVEDLADRVDMVEAGTIPDPLVLDEMHANVKMRATSYEPLGGTTLDVTAEAVDMQEVGEPVQVRHDLANGSTAFGADVDDDEKLSIAHATGTLETKGSILTADVDEVVADAGVRVAYVGFRPREGIADGGPTTARAIVAETGNRLQVEVEGRLDLNALENDDDTPAYNYSDVRLNAKRDITGAAERNITFTTLNGDKSGGNILLNAWGMLTIKSQGNATSDAVNITSDGGDINVLFSGDPTPNSSRFTVGEDRLLLPFVQTGSRHRVNWTALATTGATINYLWWPPQVSGGPAAYDIVVQDVFVHTVEDFLSDNIVTLDIIVGTVTANDGFVLATDVQTAGQYAVAPGDKGTLLTTAGYTNRITSAQGVRIEFNLAGGDQLWELTAGECVIYIVYYIVPKEIVAP